jgi:hypothetical protein
MRDISSIRNQRCQGVHRANLPGFKETNTDGDTDDTGNIFLPAEAEGIVLDELSDI